jgi:hypothetical protein
MCTPGFFGIHRGIGIGEDIELAAARGDFLEVGLELFQQRVVGRDG